MIERSYWNLREVVKFAGQIGDAAPHMEVCAIGDLETVLDSLRADGCSPPIAAEADALATVEAQ
jgi:hypothetical protein